ncbi:MAG: 30S ribosomal protein S12 methylthiotransferase RimO, partial [Eubacteriales bacterium]|nr:30S ribosomal protein S12 methylthiotransferase RimO [Eubacteriales bacterium]
MPTIGVVSLGCSKNRVDTELMLSILEKAGYELTADERQADILIVNTCGFIDPAKQESIDTLLSLAEYKKKGRLKLLVATGCLVQRYEKSLLQELPEVDLLVGVNEYERLPLYIQEALAGKRAAHCGGEVSVLSGSRVLTTAPWTAYVRIADGCDNRCA